MYHEIKLPPHGLKPCQLFCHNFHISEQIYLKFSVGGFENILKIIAASHMLYYLQKRCSNKFKFHLYEI